jgi:hypothetical protein
MKRNTGFALKMIENIPYLLPFGQNIADRKRGIQLNETGAFLWNAMETIHTKEGLVEALANHYQISKSEELSDDIEYFLEQLQNYGMITREETRNATEQILCIGGLYLRLCGAIEAVSKNFLPFTVSTYDKIDLTIEIKLGSPIVRENGVLLVRNYELFVCEKKDSYLFLFPTAKQILEATLKKDASYACFYINPPFEDELQTDLFHAIRLVFLYLAQKHNMFAIHSSSILYQGKAWLFSGHSGMGKSTHTKLWNTLYHTPLINGDLNLMTITSDGPIIHGIPWCGTSEIYDTKTYPLGGIVLLGRATTNSCEELSPNEQALLVMQRLISPSWTEDLFSYNLDFTTKLTKQIPICRLKCTKEPLAAQTMKEWIDTRLC